MMLLLACSKGPSPALTSQEELNTFEIAEGFKIQLVAEEPMIQDPIVIRFDEDGRIWVVEMRGFMPTIDGDGEDAPVGRVSVLFDLNEDGVMDSSTVFVDSLVLPRALAVVKGGALVAEDAILWYFEDTNGDFRADHKTLVDPEYGNKGVVEHSANGLLRGMDNWIYNAKSKYRYRQVDGKWIKQETEFRGQWGICHDNLGRLYYNYNWSQLHTDLVPPNYLSRNLNHQPSAGIDYSMSHDRRVFPIRSNRAINRGYVEGTLDQEGKIIEFASACAPFIYRGHLLGEDMVGNAFVCEPTGNLVKRNLLGGTELNPTATNAYQKKEFLASTDERFRPVWLESGPDGALYIVDMYRGIVQHGPYMSPYLREITLKRKLDQPINLGRIWKIVPENQEVFIPPLKLSSSSSTKLVELLAHQNGWYRDMAQRMLVDRSDDDIIDALEHLVLTSTSRFAKLHALWTLEGLAYSDFGFFSKALEDPDPQVKTATLRIMEQEAVKNPQGLLTLKRALQDPSLHLPELQVTLTAGCLNGTDKHGLLLDILSRHPGSQVYRDAVISSLYQEEYQFLTSVLEHPNWQEPSSEKEITLEQLAAAVANKQHPIELTALLQQFDGDEFDWKQQALLNGLSFHRFHSDSTAIMLDKAPGIFTRFSENDPINDKVSRASMLFTWPGKRQSPSDETPEHFETDPGLLSRGRNLYLTVCASCHGNDGQGMSRFAPPLLQSEWVLGDEERLSKILLHGIEGALEVNGKLYDSPEILPAMPAFATTPPEDLAAIMTYIRQSWGHNAAPVKPGTVGRIRVFSQGKVTPWTAEELLGE
jgi:mono/diheme cytochrome c family protein